MQTAVDHERLIKQAEKALSPYWEELTSIALLNQTRVMQAFQEHRLSTEAFAGSTGYGLNDWGREQIDSVFAQIMGAEAAAVRLQLVSGTHALACALSGNLRPGQRMVCLTGMPYDRINEVIGLKGNNLNSLQSQGISCLTKDLISYLDDEPHLVEELKILLKPPTSLAYIQRSCGYTFGRKSLQISNIKSLVKAIRQINPSCLVLVDNCYGEFVEDKEPISVGADLVAGSLIKNPGGGLALTGGYLAGKKHLVESALERLTAPGIGGHLGLTFGQNRLILQGLFMAPSIVLSALKGATLFAYVFDQLGFEVNPQPFAPRADIIQSIKLEKPEVLKNFCQAIQRCSPINAHVTPEPSPMPGYSDLIIMAGGTFIEGSTIELSADGPLRPPYAVFVQGGLNYLHTRYTIKQLLELQSFVH